MTLVVDASIAVKWIFPEAGSDAAVALRDEDHDLIAPSLIAAEIGNTIWKAVRRGHVGRADALEAIDAALIWFQSLIPMEELRVRALALAINLRHPIYDCFYLALAERARCPLITADLRLVDAAKTIKGIKLRAL